MRFCRMLLKMKTVLLFVCLTTAAVAAAPAEEIQRLDPAASQIVPVNAKLERLATGFDKWTEGPVWTRAGFLLFAEIPANNIVKWAPGKGASVFIHPSGYQGK